MLPSRYVAYFVLAPLLAASWILIACTNPTWPNWPVVSNCLFGTLFGQATLAAAWSALGPLPFVWRLPLSLAWVALLAIAFATHVGLHLAGPVLQPLTLVVMASVGGCWLFVQIPLWCLASIYGLRVRHSTDASASARDRQFGIRQVMFLTLVVALVLGILRWIAGEAAARIAFSGPNNWKAIAFFIFPAVADIVMMLPLLLAALLPRYAGWATAGVLLLIVGATCLEQFALSASIGGVPVWQLGILNGVQAAWMLTVVAVLRMCGYGIGPRIEHENRMGPAHKSG